MNRTLFGLPTMVAIAAAIFGHLSPATALAQVLDPLAGSPAYITASPNDPNTLGLATPGGRFALTLAQGCEGLGPGSDVLIYPDLLMAPWLAMTTPDGDPAQGYCLAHVSGLMSNTPCATNDQGVCDASLDSAPGGDQ